MSPILFNRSLLIVVSCLLAKNTVDGFSPLVHHAADPIHLSSTLPNLLTAYKAQLSAHPLPTKMLTGATLAVCGDAIAQRRANKNDASASYDLPRAASFAVFDMAYRALQHFSFPILVEQCRGQFLGAMSTLLLASFLPASDIQHAAASMEQTLGSQLLIVPLFYYPAFFTLTGIMQGLDGEGMIQRARDNFVPLMQRNLLFWIPVQFVQFGFVPTDLQIPFLSCAGLAWTFILSVAAGSAKQYNAPTPPPPPSVVTADATSSPTVEIQGIPGNSTIVEGPEVVKMS